MTLNRLIFLGLIGYCLLAFFSCKSSKNNPLKDGIWRATLKINDSDELPFNFELKKDPANGNVSIDFINASERIKVNEVTYFANNDSIVIQFPLYNSRIYGKVNDRRIVGAWQNYARDEKGYEIPFYATWGDSTRFINNFNDPTINVNGKWETMFIAADKSGKNDAVGEFIQEGTRITGTFRTPTGDYRYLEGSVVDSSIYLSCFDGAHAYLLMAEMVGDSTLQGEFFYGNGGHDIWVAYKNDTASLPNPNKLISTKQPNTEFNFKAKNLDGSDFDISKATLNGKAAVIQIMGTWCPNCRDESELLVNLYKTYSPKNVQFISIAFEYYPFNQCKAKLEKYKQFLNIPFPLLYGGQGGKNMATESLPMLDIIKAFPTTLFIDKNGIIKTVHTGFSGPATSQYNEQIKIFEHNIDELLNNKQP